MSSSYDKVARNEAAKADPFSEQRAAYRAYNNYFKAAQIRTALNEWTATTCPNGISVLDLASGRGGDLAKVLVKNKTQAVPVSVYAALDISKDSIAEAKRRYDLMIQNPRLVTSMGLNGGQPQVLIDVANVFDTEGVWKNHMALTTRKFEVVAMQFALHYGCSSVENLRKFLQCVSDVLVEGGTFIGTTVDASSLKQKIIRQEEGKDETNHPDAAKRPHFNVTLQNPEQDLPRVINNKQEKENTNDDNNKEELPIGISYRFQLDSLVDDVEFSIPWTVLKEEAEKAGLVAVESECKNLYDPKFRGGYIPSDDNKVRPKLMTNDEELISFYLGFVFRKQKKVDA